MSRLTRIVRAGERRPVQPAHLLVERLPEGSFLDQPEKIARRVVEVRDPPARIGDDDALLDGVEDGFEKPFFAHHAQQVPLGLVRPHPPEPGDELVDEAGFHGGDCVA